MLLQLDSSWVLANLTEQLPSSPTEGGFLMGLGLSGHLDSLPDIALCNLFSQVWGAQSHCTIMSGTC